MHRFTRAAMLGLMLVASAAATAETVVQPVQVGAETVRYRQGSPTLDLRKARGAVQVRPLPLDHGSLAFAVAVFNGNTQPANIDIGNFSGEAGDQHLGVLAVDTLIRKAKSRALWSQIAIGAIGGLAAAAAASQQSTYTASTYSRFGSSYTVMTGPSVVGQLQAIEMNRNTAAGIAAIQGRLDATIDGLHDGIVQTTTVDPGQTYGGKIVLEKLKVTSLPQRVTLNVQWNGELYSFAFQLAKPGTPAPVFTAITSPEALRGPATAAVAAPAPTFAPAAGITVPAPAASPFVIARATPALEAAVQRTAQLMPRPTALEDGTAIHQFAASGAELTLTAAAAPADAAARSEIGAAICHQRAFSPLLHQGATVRTVFGKGKAEDLVVTAASCGFS